MSNSPRTRNHPWHTDAIRMFYEGNSAGVIAKALGHPTRNRVTSLLRRRGLERGGEKSAICINVYVPKPATVSRRRLKDAAPDLLGALQTFVDDYVQMINSGDCGNWDPEAEPKVIAARSALAKATGQ